MIHLVTILCKESWLRASKKCIRAPKAGKSLFAQGDLQTSVFAFFEAPFHYQLRRWMRWPSRIYILAGRKLKRPWTCLRGKWNLISGCNLRFWIHPNGNNEAGPIFIGMRTQKHNFNLRPFGRLISPLCPGTSNFSLAQQKRLILKGICSENRAASVRATTTDHLGPKKEGFICFGNLVSSWEAQVWPISLPC